MMTVGNEHMPFHASDGAFFPGYLQPLPALKAPK